MRNLRRYVAFALIGLLGVAISTVSVRVLRPSNRIEGVVSDVCPDCGKKLLRSDAKCNYCQYLKIRRLMAGDKAAEEPRRIHPAIKFGALAGVLALIVLALYWTTLRGFFRESPADHAVFRCDKCRKKLRYRMRNVGQPGKCPKCGTLFVFPEMKEKVGVE